MILLEQQFTAYMPLLTANTDYGENDRGYTTISHLYHDLHYNSYQQNYATKMA